MERREFLRKTSAYVSTAYLASCVSVPKAAENNQKRLAFFSIANSREHHPQGHRVGGTTRMYILNTETSELKAHALQIKSPHSLIQHPYLKNVAVITPRDQAMAIALNIDTGKTLKLISLDKEQNFYGHGFFSADGERIFLTGYDKYSVGFLKEYDLNWNELGHVETFGRAPHDVKCINDGKIIMVANNGWSGRDSYAAKNSSSMVYLDLKSRKLIERVELPLGYIGFQHFERNEQGDFVVACDHYGTELDENYKSLLGYRKISQPLSFLDISVEMRARLHGNTLSIAWDYERGKIFTTTPEGPVTVWDLDRMQAVNQVLNQRYPHGVAISETDVFITTSNDGVWVAKNNAGFKPESFIKMDLPIIENISAHSIWIK